MKRQHALLLCVLVGCGASPSPAPLDTASDLPACPNFSFSQAGVAPHPSLIEISGVVASRTQPDVLWVHNDSGDMAKLYALSTTGAHLQTVSMDGIAARDIEDIATGPPEPDGTVHLYIGDIGDNNEVRDNITILRTPEPLVTAGGKEQTLSAVETFGLRYPNGAKNAESLMIDPMGKELFVLTKDWNGNSELYSISLGALVPESTHTLKHVGSMQFGTSPLIGSTTPTAADIGPLGHYIVVRTYTHAFLWLRARSELISDALMRPPCTIFMESEPQGEAIGFSGTGDALYSISEGVNQPLYRYERMPR